MPNLPAKTHVADGSCGCCGKSVKILLNKNGNAYYFCGWSDNGQQCSHHERWGKAASQKFQRDYLENRKSANDNSAPQPPETANDNSAPDAGPEKRPTEGGGGLWYE